MRLEEAVHRNLGQAAEVHMEEAYRSQAAAERSHPFRRTQEQRPGCLGNHEARRVLGSGLAAGSEEEVGLEGSHRAEGRAAAAAAAAGQAGLGIAVAVGSEPAVGEVASTVSNVSQGTNHARFANEHIEHIAHSGIIEFGVRMIYPRARCELETIA
jgi:hypothetical protein